MRHNLTFCHFLYLVFVFFYRRKRPSKMANKLCRGWNKKAIGSCGYNNQLLLRRGFIVFCVFQVYFIAYKTKKKKKLKKEGKILHNSTKYNRLGKHISLYIFKWCIPCRKDLDILWVQQNINLGILFKTRIRNTWH